MQNFSQEGRCVVNPFEPEQHPVLAVPDAKELHNVKRKAWWGSIKDHCTLHVYLVGDDEQVKPVTAKPGLNRGVLVYVVEKGRIQSVDRREAMLGELGLLAELRDRLDALCASAVQTETTEKLTAIRERMARVKTRIEELRKLEAIEARNARRVS